MRPRLALVLLGFLFCIGSSGAGAQAITEDVFHERLAWGTGLSLVAPISSPQSEWFSPGLALELQVLHTVNHFFAAGGRLRGALLFNGEDKRGSALEDRDVGTFITLDGYVRVRPFGEAGDPRRMSGFWVGASIGPALSADKFLLNMEAEIGYAFNIAALTFGPHIRYTHFAYFSDELDDRDARFIEVGLTAYWGEPAATASHRWASNSGAYEEDEPDEDNDGIGASSDQCPLKREDLDGFEDEDGCPDMDNDGDRLRDALDQCPNEAEDEDGFRDLDGCPELDNDLDLIPDEEDRCPLEAESWNGNRDSDGCPDKGRFLYDDGSLNFSTAGIFAAKKSTLRGTFRPFSRAILRLSKSRKWQRIAIQVLVPRPLSEEAAARQGRRRAAAIAKRLRQLGLKADVDIVDGGLAIEAAVDGMVIISVSKEGDDE